MPAARAIRRARAIGRAVGSVVKGILEQLPRPERGYNLRSECERLEDRRLLSVSISMVGSTPTWTAYSDFSYDVSTVYVNTGTTCQQMHLLHVHSGYEVASGPVPENPTLDDLNVHATDQYSLFPIAWSNGQPIISDTDIDSSGFGQTFGQTRSWTNNRDGAYTNGDGWTSSNAPYLVISSNSIAAVFDANTQEWFDPAASSNSWSERGGGQDQLTKDTVTGAFTLTDAEGQVFLFNGFSGAAQGQIASLTDAAGNSTTYNYSSGKLSSIIRSNGSTYERWLYSYISSSDTYNGGLLASVQLQRSTDSGSTYATAEEADYAYWQTGDVGGNNHDLKSVTTKINGASTGTKVYRYYTSNPNSNFPDRLKYVFESDSYARAVAAGVDPLTSTDDSSLQQYCDNYFGYGEPLTEDPNHLFDYFVTSEIAQGGSCSCVGNSGDNLYTYDYTLAPASTYTDGYNHWMMQTKGSMPDGTTETVFTNFAGEVMLSDVVAAGSTQHNYTYNRYDGQGHLIVQAEPSAVLHYDPALAELVDLSSTTDLNQTTGLIHDYVYSGWSFGGTDPEK